MNVTFVSDTWKRYPRSSDLCPGVNGWYFWPFNDAYSIGNSYRDGFQWKYVKVGRQESINSTKAIFLPRSVDVTLVISPMNVEWSANWLHFGGYYTCDGEAGGRGGSVQQNGSNYKAIKYVKSTYLLSEGAKNCPIWPPLKVYVILVMT